MFFFFFLFFLSQYACPTIPCRNQPPRTARFSHGLGAILNRSRRRLWILDRILYTNKCVFSLSPLNKTNKCKVPGSLSWRIPLGIQILPGVILGLGCSFLPPSPRFLVMKGRFDEALASLARLRLRTKVEAEDDPLLQVCLSHSSTFHIYFL